MQEYEKAKQASDHLKALLPQIPDTAIILGTGLNGLVDGIDDPTMIPYAEIPHFIESTAPSHSGVCIFGKLDKKPILCFSGRHHYYEGYNLKEVTLPIRVMKLLGITDVIMSNAAGGVNPDFNAGDIVMVRDHINMQPDNPLRGENDVRFGPRFPDMSEAYDPRMRNLAIEIGRLHNIHLQEGVYVSLPGPNLETPAEYDFLHRIGGDLVGMSTVPEVIVARHCGLKVCVFSIVTNVCYPPEVVKHTTAEEVIVVAASASVTLQKLVKEMLNAEPMLTVSAS